MSTTDPQKHFIDFVAELPHEVIPIIFSNFSTKELAECLHVSSIWTSQLLNSICLWRDVKISDVETDFIKSLRRVAPFIKKLTVCEDADLVAAFRMLSDCSFDSLRSLALEIEMPEDSIYDSCIYPALSNVGKFLEEVSFAYLDSAQLPLTRILDYCPDLERMKFNGYYEGDIESKTTPVHTISKLTHAFIHIDPDVEPEQVRLLLRRSPKLQQLHISYCKSEILDIIFDCCPDLPYLKFNMAALELRNDVHMEFADFHVGDERGMRVLDVAVYSRESGPLNITQFTQRSTTLQEFGYYEFRGSPRRRLNPWFASKNLRRFYWDAFMDQITLSSIISQCPLIQDVKFTEVRLESLLLLITRLTQLQRLHLEGGGLFEGKDLEQFLMSWKLSNTLVPNTLVLDECTLLGDTTIGYLAELPSLHKIVLISNDYVTEAGVDAFAEKLQYSNVKHIQFESMNSVTDTTLAKLGAGRLETVSLLGLDHVTFHGLCELVDHAPSLRQLHVFQCGAIQDSALSTFKGINVCTTESLP